MYRQISDNAKEKLFCQNYTEGLTDFRLIHVVPEDIRKKLGDSSPVVKNSTLMFLWCLYGELFGKGYSFITIDIKTAFLTAEIDINEKHKKKIFVTKPSFPFKNQFHTPMVKPKKSCYGLNIAPKNFYLKLTHILVGKLGYKISPGDECFFYHPKLGMIVSHVDDLAIVSKDPDEMHRLIHEQLETKVTDDPEYYVGYELETTSRDFSFGCQQYIEQKFREVLDDRAFDMVTKPTSSPTTSHFKYLEEPPRGTPSCVTEEFIKGLEQKSFPQANPKSKRLRQPRKQWIFVRPQKPLTVQRIQQLMGVLTYITSHSRWDLRYYTSVLSRYNHHPTSLLYQCIIQLYRYIYSTRHFRTVYQFSNDLQFQNKLHIDIYSDASFKHTDARNAYKGYLVTINDRYWDSNSSRVKIGAVSTLQTELLAAYDALSSVICRHQLLSTAETFFLNHEITHTLHIDNQALFNRLNALNDPSDMEKSYSNKLIIMRQWIKDYNVEVKFLSGKLNPTDIHTKDVEQITKRGLYNSTVLNKCTNVVTDKVPAFPKPRQVETSS